MIEVGRVDEKGRRTKLPARPARQLNPTISKAHQAPNDLHPSFSIHRSITPTKPIISPPRTDTPNPSGETPPLVPFGTVSQVNTCRGRAEERIPSSEANVSARDVEKWLHRLDKLGPTRLGHDEKSLR